MNEPAIILYIRAALPGWTVVADDRGCPVATHPDGSRVRWRLRWNGGSPARCAEYTRAVARCHGAELEPVGVVYPPTHEPVHTADKVPP